MRNLPKKAQFLLFIFVLLVCSTGCNKKPADSDERILREQIRMMIIVEAQQSFNDLFKASFNPERTELLI